jgi:hypothetical protein
LPLDPATVYGPFADSYRVTDATSLLDYAAGQDTATFTDRNFPGDAVDLAAFPADLVAAAESLASKAGITDAGLQAAAALDYLTTGNPEFFTQGSNQQQEGVLTASIEPGPTAPLPIVGVYATTQQLQENASGPTLVPFLIYRTGDTSSPLTLSYAVDSPSSSFLSAQDFGGVLPSGTVTFAAGQSRQAIDIAVPNGIGDAMSKSLEVTLSAPFGTTVGGSAAQAKILTDRPTAGGTPVFALDSLEIAPVLGAAGWVLDLGNLKQGAAIQSVNILVRNAGTSGADDLSGSLIVSGDSAIVAGYSPSFLGLGADAEQNIVDVQEDTSQAGTFGKDIAFTLYGSNSTGFSALLPSETLTITDHVFALAQAQIGPSATIDFGVVRTGDSAVRLLSVTNTATTGAEALDAAAGPSTGPVSAHGAVTGLAPGATDGAGLSIVLDTGSAGLKTGTATVSLASDGAGVDGLGATALEGQSLSVTGTVYATAVAQLGTTVVDLGPLHPGQAGTATLTVTNAATGALTDLLEGGFVDPTAGPFSVAGTLGAGLAAGASTSFTVSFSGETGIGTWDSYMPLAFTSHDAAQADAAALGATSVEVEAAVQAYAVAAFEDVSGSGTFTQNGNAYTLNLGTFVTNSGAVTVGLGVLNAATSVADALSGSFTVNGSAAFSNAGLAAFAGLDAGQADTAPTVTLSTTSAGTFTETITLDPTGYNATGYAGALGPESLTITGTVLGAIACFLAGTRILTSLGERAVNVLAIGDVVHTHGGRLAPVTWIGHRRIDCRRHPVPQTVWPVRISPNAFGPGMPHRNLWLSPDHAVFVDGLLIAVRQLVNGATIAQIPHDTVTYFHVELARHDILMAEGLPAESYLDTGNRAAFENAGTSMMLHPDFARRGDDTRAGASCAPLAVGAEQVEAVWRRLAARAAASGAPVSTPEATTDPSLRLIVDGREIAPVEVKGSRYVFVLPPRAEQARIASRAAAPSDLRPWLDDRRKLGVPISQIVLRDRTGATDIPPDHPALREGWHDVEKDANRLWRWTDGDAALSFAAGTKMIEVHLSGCSEYPAHPEKFDRYWSGDPSLCFEAVGV